MWLNYPGISITQPSRPDSGEPRSSQVTCICQVHELCHFAIDPHRPGGRSFPTFSYPFFWKRCPKELCLYGATYSYISRTFREAKTQSCDVRMKHTYSILGLALDVLEV